MNDSIKEMFDQIHMPEACEAAIRQAARQEVRRPVFRPAAVLAMLMAVVLVTAGAFDNVVRAAVLEAAEKVVEFVFPVSNDETTMKKPNSLNPRVEVEDGRVYLWTFEETIDITEKFSMETPYIHIYTDVGGKEHILIVGGTPEDMGYCKFTRDPSAEGGEAWLSGSSYAHMDRDGNLYPWAQAAWEELDIPWPT